ncbi:MAG: hypothetical protein JW956_00555 [Calditrichaceae bacterium]|nr:hypothetical protein [Calditrichaceae bacterium]
MFGKGALIMVMGAVIIFSLYQLKLNRSILSTTDNFNRQYTKTTLEAAAQSAMNYAINDVMNNGTTDRTYFIYSHNCTSQVKIEPFFSGEEVQATVVSNGWVVDEFDPDKMRRTQDSIVAMFSNSSSLSEYGWYSDNENGVFWITGDTCYGKMHSNKMIHTKGEPVFKKKVTSAQGINPSLKKTDAHFEGGYEKIPNQSIPTDMTKLQDLAISGNGGAPMNTKSLYDKDLYLEFLADGQVVRTVSGVTDTMLVTDIAPDGAIWTTKDVHVKGILDGKISILANDDIWIDDDVLMKKDPKQYTDSDDALGLVAKDDIFVTNNTANQTDCNIQAGLCAINGSFQAEDWSSRGPCGRLTVYGSITQNVRGPVGNFQDLGWGGLILKNGFKKSYYHDKRFDPSEENVTHIMLPGYPTISGNGLKLVHWWE